MADVQERDGRCTDCAETVQLSAIRVTVSFIACPKHRLWGVQPATTGA